MAARPTAVVTGGAGFLGSHIVRRLLERGSRVICIDNLLTGRRANVDSFAGNPDFDFIEHDVTNYIDVPGQVDSVFHLASPASPLDYLEYPIKTLKVGALGTHNALGLAKAKNAAFFLASSSEVYGDPSGDMLVVSWGGTFGACKTAVDRMRHAGHAVSHIHLRYLNPLPRNLPEILQNFQQVVVPELNTGQLQMVLRAKYLVPVEGLNKIQGKPFTESEIVDYVNATLKEQG